MRSFRGSSAPAPVEKSPLPVRVKALNEAADLAAGRSAEAAVAEAKRVARQTDRRLALSGASTVVTLAGTTGSGKSSLFNAISGTQMARSGVRRPTTDASMAAYWGAEVPSDLLHWLDVTDRRPVKDGDRRFNGLVLIDLPDHDSTHAAHKVEVDRMIRLVDVMIWVLDPQKYADNVLHEQYLRPLAPYASSMFIVLNQVDRLSAEDLRAAVADLRKLLIADGLGKATLLTTSALTGQGIEDMRDVIAERVADKKAAAARLAIDVSQAAQGLLGDVTRQRRRYVTDEAKAALAGALDEVAGVPQVVTGVARATRQKGDIATGWPLISWIDRLRPDPLKMLRSGASGGGLRPQGVGGAVALAKVDGALRQLSTDVTAGMSPGWAAAVREAAVGRRDQLPAALNDAVARTDVGVDTPMRWWRVIRVAQWVLIGVVALGILWALFASLLSFVTPAWRGLSAPALMIVGGLALGVVVALCSGAAVDASARRRAAQASLALKAQVAAVAQEQVLAPVAAELDRYAAFVAAVARAL